MKVKFSSRCLMSTSVLLLLACASHPGPGKHPRGFLHPSAFQHWVTSSRNGLRAEQPVPSSPCSPARPQFAVPQFMVPSTSHYTPGSAFSFFSVCWRRCSPSGTRFDPPFLSSAELFPLLRWGFPKPQLCRVGQEVPSPHTTCRAPAA